MNLTGMDPSKFYFSKSLRTTNWNNFNQQIKFDNQLVPTENKYHQDQFGKTGWQMVKFPRKKGKKSSDRDVTSDYVSTELNYMQAVQGH